MREKREIADLALLILLFPLYLVARLIPRDRHLYIFGSSLGRHLADNSKYLFLYVSDHLPQVKAVFVSEDRDVVALIKSSGGRAEYLYSIAGIRAIVRANKCFLSHSIRDIRLLRLGNSEIIQLWHGTPLKKINYDVQPPESERTGNLKRRMKRLLYRLLPYVSGDIAFDRIVASSEEVGRSFVTAFRISPEQVFVGGQPRNDCLLGQVKLDPALFPETETIAQLKRQFRHLIVWMPTHRGRNKNATMNDLLDRYGFDESAMTRLLEECDACLIVKAHFVEQNNMQVRFAGNSRILTYDHVDPYPLLAETSVLITDYSSIIFDFLLVDRPIIFAAFDLEEYCRTIAGLYYDYSEVTPGPKCASWSEVADAIRTSLQAPRTFAVQRRAVRDRFNHYSGGFAARIAGEFIANDKH